MRPALEPEPRPAGVGPMRRLAHPLALVLLAGLLAFPEAGPAGTGRLLSGWMSQAPTIDGKIDAGEWSAASLVDLGDGVTVRIGSDGRTLYLALLDSADLGHGIGDAYQLYFDDEGGDAPVLDDDLYDNSGCQGVAELGEGLLSFEHDQNVDYYEIAQSGACPYQFLPAWTSFRSLAQPEGVTYETAVPLDGPTPLRAGTGRRFGIALRVFRNGTAVACLPNCAALNPPDYRNLILASGGCNTGPQNFGGGDPRIGLPLDWTSGLYTGSGQGWVQTLPPFYGDPVFCDANDTGGSGAAACVANVFHTSPRTDAWLAMPLPIAGQTTATVRLRAVLVTDPGGAGQYEYLSFDVERHDGSGSTLGFWLGQDQSGALLLPLPLGGSPPVEVVFTHSAFSTGGLEGGFAQVDDVELLCGPILFADGFESRLTTHWSATIP